MFTPTIYTTHKLIKRVVGIELYNLEYILKYEKFVEKDSLPDLVNVVDQFQREELKLDHSLRDINLMLQGTKTIDQLVNARNAVQAIKNYRESIRAEDDWNLLLRINQLFHPFEPTDSFTRVREKEDRIKHLLTPLEFQTTEQLKHFVVELFRWYRKSDAEMNEYIRIAVLLYYLLKVMPFKNHNVYSIFICMNFYFRENKIKILRHTANFEKLTKELKSRSSLDLNEFISFYLDHSISEAKRHIYDYNKHETEVSSPKKVLSLNQRQIELLKILQVRDKIKRSEAAKLLGVSFMTVYRDIKVLLARNILIESGRGRGTFYTLASKKNNKSQ